MWGGGGSPNIFLFPYENSRELSLSSPIDPRTWFKPILKILHKHTTANNTKAQIPKSGGGGGGGRTV